MNIMTCGYGLVGSTYTESNLLNDRLLIASVLAQNTDYRATHLHGIRNVIKCAKGPHCNAPETLL